MGNKGLNLGIAGPGTPPSTELVTKACTEAISRGMPMVGVVPPTAGSIVHRVGNGAVVLTDRIGEDAETGADIYSAIAMVVWDQIWYDHRTWDDVWRTSVRIFARDYADRHDCILLGPAEGMDLSRIIARTWGGLVLAGPLPNTVQYMKGPEPIGWGE